MKIDVTCALVRDLLPLYADGVLSEESSSVVEGHLPECPPCAAELERLRAPVPVQKKSAKHSLKATRRKLAAGLGVALLLVLAIALVSIRFLPRPYNAHPIPYYEGLIDIDSLKMYRDELFPGSGLRGDFLFVQPARAPEFEYYGFGSACAEDEIILDGERVGVLFVQFCKDPADMARSAKMAAKNGGRNPDIQSFGGSMYSLDPETQEEKEYREANGYFPRTTLTVPISRLYYSTDDLLGGDQEPGWSERSGVLENSVLVWESTGERKGVTELPPRRGNSVEETTAMPWW